ncbi:MAG: TIGR04283 family arsenosugar biosynthesis glycosyltransferase [Planctomycetes bacterium]|nr:TIGR04283 family arsenosugar biosynthesis glycosyltransferase [Planctomycetota bacterium]
MQQPSLGVAICALDEERALPRLLERLSSGAADDRADDVVVADGRSRDRTVDVARALGARVIVAPRGRGAQLGAAARELSTDVLVFLHADCVPSPGTLRTLRAAFVEARLEAAAFRQRVDARGVFYRAVERAADARVRALGLVYGDSGLAVRRSLYERVGGFRDLPLFEDVELSRRLRSATRVRLVPGTELVISARRWQREGALRTTLRNWMLMLAFAAGADPVRLARHYPPHSEPPG